MGFVDVLGAEDRVEITVSQFSSIMKEVAKVDFLVNAVNCDVPHQYIRAMISGNKENKEGEK